MQFIVNYALLQQTNQRGLVKHFEAITDAVKLPVVVTMFLQERT